MPETKRTKTTKVTRGKNSHIHYNTNVQPLNTEITHEAIAKRAFEIYQERIQAHADASPEQDWYQAVFELTAASTAIETALIGD